MTLRPVTLMALALAACSAPASPTASPPAVPVTAPAASGGADAEAPRAAATAASTPATPATATTPAPADVPGTPKERLMRSHFKETALIRTAVIDGVLTDAAAPAEALANVDGLGKIEPAWQSSIDVLQYAAKRIRRSSDIPAAAAAIADIGIACGACHKAAGGPDPKLDAAPATDATLASRMRRHAWATERLWEGIYVPSDASWKAGATALSGEPFPREVLDKGDVHARASASRFKSLVATAATKKTPDERGQLYGSLLETCSACHLVTRMKK